MSEPDRVPSPRPDELLALLRRHQAAELAFRNYLLGLLDGLGIPRERLAGVDDDTGEILLTPED